MMNERATRASDNWQRSATQTPQIDREVSYYSTTKVQYRDRRTDSRYALGENAVSD